MKSGRSAAGARATSSHTGAMLAASDVTVDALFRQAGVIRTDSLQELFDVASLLGHQPPPRGRRVAILTNAGGPGILCADACEATRTAGAVADGGGCAAPAAFLPAEAGLSNPVDMIASAVRRGLPPCRRGGGRCGCGGRARRDLHPAARHAVRGRGGRAPVGRGCARRAAPAPHRLHVVVVAAGRAEPTRSEAPAGVRVPGGRGPRAGHGRSSTASGRRGPRASHPVFDDVRTDEAAGLIASALSGGAGWAPPETLAGLLDCYGIARVEELTASSATGAGRAAEQMGGSVVLKAVVPGLIHKTEAGSVRLGLNGRRQVTAAARGHGRPAS